jgi:Polyketide cyclase / dehydrase and lipid transport
MLIAQHSIKTQASPAAIFRLWSQVSSWPRWDDEVVESHLDGPFVKGTTGWLKPKGGPKVRFELLSVEPNVMFHDRASLPFAKLDFVHEIQRDGAFTVVTHRIEMTGPLAFLFSRILGGQMKKGLPLAMAKLVTLALQTTPDEDAQPKTIKAV